MSFRTLFIERIKLVPIRRLTKEPECEPGANFCEDDKYALTVEEAFEISNVDKKITQPQKPVFSEGIQ